MSKNKIFVYFTILLVVLLIAIPSTYKVIKKHNDRLMRNTIGMIVGSAKDCYYNESCVGDIITLKELYEKTGLSMTYNPVTKRIYNEESYVSVNDDFKFIPIE